MSEKDWSIEMPDAQDWLENCYGADADSAYTAQELLEAIEEYQRTVEKPLRERLEKKKI